MCSKERSQLPNFFDLKLCKAVAHAFLSFDCHNLRGVVCQLGVDRLTRFAGQQINFSISIFDSSGLPIPDAHSCEFGALGTAEVGSNLPSHIDNFDSR